MTDTIKIHKMIDGELIPLKVRRQRFEQTMDRIDDAVDKGATASQVFAEFSDYIVRDDSETAPTTSNTTEGELSKSEKAALVASIIAENPQFTLGEVCKAAQIQGGMTYANARYLALKEKAW